MQQRKESQNSLSTIGKSVSASLESLGNCISNGLTMLAMAMNPKVMRQYQMQNQGSDGSFPRYTPLQSATACSFQSESRHAAPSQSATRQQQHGAMQSSGRQATSRPTFYNDWNLYSAVEGEFTRMLYRNEERE